MGHSLDFPLGSAVAPHNPTCMKCWRIFPKNNRWMVVNSSRSYRGNGWEYWLWRITKNNQRLPSAFRVCSTTIPQRNAKPLAWDWGLNNWVNNGSPAPPAALLRYLPLGRIKLQPLPQPAQHFQYLPVLQRLLEMNGKTSIFMWEIHTNMSRG